MTVRITIDVTLEDEPGALKMLRERVTEGAQGYVSEYLDLERAGLDPRVEQTSVDLQG